MAYISKVPHVLKSPFHHFASIVDVAQDDSLSPQSLQQRFGGKAAKLTWLTQHGFQVPEAFVLPTAKFDSLLQSRFNFRTLLSPTLNLELASQAYEFLRQAPLDESILKEIETLMHELKPQAPWGLAVRSSATCEDNESTSLAGLASTVLGVHDSCSLADAIREVWASLLLPRALSYLAQRNIFHASMAVIVQKIVPAEVSGVATCEYAKGTLISSAQNTIIDLHINATYGLGIQVVSGASTPDVFYAQATINEHTRALDVSIKEQTIAQKSRKIVIEQQDLKTCSVASELISTPALNLSYIEKLSALSQQLLQLDRRAWDLEFAIAQNQIWLLQARPLVELPLPEGGTQQTVWSCANLAEALPGVATPLTWSVASQFSEVGFRHAFTTLGCEVPNDAHFLGNIQGRFYLNLSSFMRVASQVPGLDPLILIELAGGEGASILTEQIKDVSHVSFYARLPKTIVQWLYDQTSIDQHIREYETNADTFRVAFETQHSQMRTNALLANQLEDTLRLLDRTGILMLQCASNSLGSFVALRKLIALRYPKDATRLTEDLTSGGALKGWGELESARPTTSLVRIAEIAANDFEAKRVFLSKNIPTSTEQIPLGPTRTAFERWLKTHGNRAIREAELSTPRWYEDPSFPLSTLALYISYAHQGKPIKLPLEEVTERADSAQKQIEQSMSVFERMALRHLIARCQKFARLRERMRAWVTWVLGSIRSIALKAGQQLVEQHFLNQIDNVFFCSIEELISTLRAPSRSLQPIVTARHAEYIRDCARPDPPITFVGRPPHVRLEALGGAHLQGHGASPGVVQGTVRILNSPTETHRLHPGDILVTKTTDVGWVPLFLCATGVITELGGPLSHASIVARELGVPCVVNVSGATARLHEGELVKLDGSSGIVEVIQSAIK